MKQKIEQLAFCLMLLAGMMTTLTASAQEGKGKWVSYERNFGKNTPIYAVALKDVAQNIAVRMFPTNVFFSETPNGEKTGYYAVNTGRFTAKIGNKKNVTKYADMEDIGNGWHLFQFDKPLYVLKDDPNVVPQNLRLLVGGKDAPSMDGTAKRTELSSTDQPFIIEYTQPKEINKPDFTTPEAAGYTLINTKKLIGNDEEIYEYNCDIFAEGVVRVNFGDGDFAVFPDNHFTKDVKALYPNSWAEPIGDLQLTENGKIIKRENGEVSITYPNGLKEVYGELRANWDMDYKTPSVSLYDPILLIDPSKSEPMKWVRIIQKDQKYSGLSDKEHTEGYLCGDRLYKISVDYQLVPVVQIVDDIPLPIACTDTIVSVEKNLTTKKRGDYYGAPEYREYDLKINYKNGDYIQTSGENVIAGSIHRNGGVLTFKKANNKLITTLTFPNGDKYVGTFGGYDSTNNYSYQTYLTFQLSELSITNIVFEDGTLIKQDGTTLEYIGRMNEQQIAEERKAEAKRKKAADAKATAEYNKLCRQYGKKYVDAAYGLYQPLVGMPEELLKKALNLELVETGNNYKFYRVLGWGMSGSKLTNAAILYSVWVSNGKVTHVKKW